MRFGTSLPLELAHTVPVIATQPAARTRIATVAAVLGDAGLVLILVLAIPFVLVVVGAPVVLLVRLVLELVARF